MILKLKMKHENVESFQAEKKKGEENIRHATTYLETIIHFVKAGIGAGIDANFVDFMISNCYFPDQQGSLLWQKP